MKTRAHFHLNSNLMWSVDCFFSIHFWCISNQVSVTLAFLIFYTKTAQKTKHTENTANIAERERSRIQLKWIAYTCLWVALFFYSVRFLKNEFFSNVFMKLYSSLSCESILLFHLVLILFRLQSTKKKYEARASWLASMNCLHYTATLLPKQSLLLLLPFC